MDAQSKPRFLPPGGLTSDLDDDETLLDAWSTIIGDGLDATIAGLGDGDVLLFNPLKSPRPDLQPRPVAWITMPAFVANTMKRPDGLRQTDTPAASGSQRNQDEYSEWFTHRDAQNRVVAVDVTTELPEYWRFLAEKRPDKALELYRRYVSPDVRLEDLLRDGAYVTENEFNSARGAMHMTTGINNLNAALGVIGGAVPWRTHGSRVFDVQFCNGFPTIGANADPTIAAHVNRMAREGQAITLQNPVGLHILGLDLDGWLRPDGKPVTRRDVVRETRGTPPVRMRIEGRGFQLWESTIGGEPIEFGSQIAERFTVGVNFAAGPPEVRHPTPQPCLAGTENDRRRP
jgi:hypothetical protein